MSVLEQARATPAPPVADPPPQRLAGLDGIRGLAALFVVVNHVFLRAFPGYPVDRAPFWAGWFIYGRFAVVVFIVLSGFSLALSPARRGWRLDGVSRFARGAPGGSSPRTGPRSSSASRWRGSSSPPPGQGAPDAKSVIVNGLLVQNLVAAPSPNRSFWSIAVEAQLYSCSRCCCCWSAAGAPSSWSRRSRSSWRRSGSWVRTSPAWTCS